MYMSYISIDSNFVFLIYYIGNIVIYFINNVWIYKF